VVKDTVVNEHSGSFTDWHLKLWGEAIDAAKTILLPMPTDEDDEDHDTIETTTALASTTTLPPSPVNTAMPTTNPADHPDRPTKPTGNPTDQGSGTETDAPAVSATHSSSWLPSFLANLSTKTQIWIYGALGLIVAFCAGLGIWLYLARRRRLRNNPRDDYEFELLDEDEAKGLNGGEKTFAAAGRKGRKTRGGELYDAFAGGSDDEDDEFGGDGYRDRSADDEADAGITEKRSRTATGNDDDDDDDGDLHHVIGDDSDDEEQQDRRLLDRR